ncbi:MAG: AAA family ATPase [Chloroflexi bacterium]|nr:AAA family ATPase [Chloroflexota bacterium]
MNCPRCETPNPEGARFCTNCGGPMQTACPQCSSPIPQGAAFCPMCGHKVGQQRVAARAPALQRYVPAELMAKLEYARSHGGMLGERRTVTVLFCDVKGSTSAAEKLDPEEWAEIMNGGFECLIAPVYRYEGTLARLMGDAILAFFGAPIAHEDDPQRAVLAALEVLDEVQPYREKVKARWGFDFNVRAGINTGLVVVGEVGSDLRMEYTALGDAVNLAARMEQTAEPGTVQIAENTHRLVAPLFDFKELGAVEVKGRAEPVRSYRVLRPRAEPGRLRGLAGLEAPLIGRETEYRSLKAALAELRAGRGQIVSVIGDAGVGKSRLVAEVRKEVNSETVTSTERATGSSERPPVAWYEGRSFSYETSTPYAPFVDLLVECLRLRSRDSPAEKYARLKAEVASVMADRTLDVAPFLATMLQLPVEGEDFERVKYLAPPLLRAQVFRATCEFFGRLGRSRPVVLVFEDLHWVDSTSLELIEHLLPVTEQSTLMLLAVYRPQRQDPSWKLHELASRDYAHRYTSLMLEPLDAKDTRTLVNTLLHIEGLPDHLRDLILKKSEGNPFFVEEVIRSLIDSGSVRRDNGVWHATREIADIAVPDTIAGVITARLDRLSESARPVVQTASVIGREFGFDILAEISETPESLETALVDLQRRGLVREKSRLPSRVFMFKHALTQETAYSTLLLSRRRDLHRKIAGSYERSDSGRAGEIARHYLEAREAEKALPWLVEAGDQAARSYSTREAIDYYLKTMGIVDQVADTTHPRRAFEGLGGAYVFANEAGKAMETYERMLEFAKARNDRPMQVSALNKSGFAAGLRMGRLEEAERRLAEAERLARDCQDYPGLLELHITHCFINTTTGRFATAMDHLSQSAQLGKDLGAGPARLLSLTHISFVLTLMRRFDDAWGVIQEAKQLALDLGHREHYAELLAAPVAMRHLRDGDLDAARRSAEEALSIASTIRAVSPEADAALMLGGIAQATGEYEKAMEWHRRAAEAGKMAGFPFMEAVSLCALGTDYFQIGQEHRDRVLELHGQAKVLMEQPLGMAYGAMCWADIGFCYLSLGDLVQADECFVNGLTRPSAPMYLVEPFLIAGRALVALAKGEAAEAVRLAAEAEQSASKHGMKNCEPMLGLVSGRIEAARGRLSEALARFESAEAAAVAMKMLPMVWQARVAAAGILKAQGRQEEAGVRSAEARAAIDDIAGDFKDVTLREQFLRGALARFAS